MLIGSQLTYEFYLRLFIQSLVDLFCAEVAGACECKQLLCVARLHRNKELIISTKPGQCGPDYLVRARLAGQQTNHAQRMKHRHV